MAKDNKSQKGKDKGKVQKEERNFLYLLPEPVVAANLAKVLDFLERRQIEIWTEVNLLELTFQAGTLTFEDMMPELTDEADLSLLADMGMKQVYACDYDAADAASVKKVMESLLACYGGILASDTEDFKPFLKPEEL